MHYVTLATVRLPQIEENEAENAEVAAEAQRVQEKMQGEILEDFYKRLFIGRATTFARAVASEVEPVMEPFWEQTEDPEYLVFDDHSQEIREQYDHDTRTCV